LGLLRFDVPLTSLNQQQTLGFAVPFKLYSAFYQPQDPVENWSAKTILLSQMHF
jgi:hypothetical protein